MSQTTSIHTFHYASPLKQAAPFIVPFTLIAPLFIFATSKPSAYFFFPYVIPIAILIDLLIYWFMTRARLEVSSAGISYMTPGLAVRSNWSNIEGYGEQKRSVFFVEEVLILREPGLETSLEVSPDRVRLLAYMIPVARFAVDWRSSELGALIKEYAPQAFDNASSIKKE